ncbi:MAG: translation initiation factor IF-2 [Bacteroidetes bacterium]|nr:translation initiation factor IF-2 [Bacteroidota bacterium]MBL7103556.1 translation initiation factor IF-2 [Bacteroidales bacterium]
MSETGKAIRLSKAAREFNIGISTIVEFLSKQGIVISTNPNTKLTPDMYDFLDKEFQLQKTVKEEALKIGLDYSDHHTISIEDKIYSDKEKEQEFEIDEILIKDSSLSKTKVEPDIEEPNEIKGVIEEKAEDIEDTIEVRVTDTGEISLKEEEQKEISEEVEDKEPTEEVTDDTQPRVVGKIDIEKIKMRTKPAKKTVKEKEREVKAEKEIEEKKKEVADEKTVKETAEEEVKKENFIKTKFEKLEGPKILDKIKLPEKKKKPEKKPVASSKDKEIKTRKKRRKRIRKKPDLVQTKDKDTKEGVKQKFKDKRGRKERVRPEISEDEVQKQIKETLAKLTGSGKSKAAKYRREKRQIISKQKKKEIEELEEEKNVIKVTEFVTANELATMMDVHINDIISTCMSLGIFVSINQRLDAETLSLVSEEFGYEVEFISVDVQEAILDAEEEDSPEQLMERVPIVTVMGHVDHGKTKLLDYIRNTNVIAGEAGGITQHIGAYEVSLKDGNKITFLDTPGHEAFTAMRARGAKITDIAIIVIAAEDDVMPQTKEAVNHAQAAGVPIVFAINKIDKPNANVEKIKEGLSKMNILVEDWGGKYQSQEISAKQGINIDELLEKVLLEAEMLDLKSNPDKLANGTVIESSLDKGRGYVAKVLVQNGTLKTGDILIAGSTFGRVKAMYNERNQRNDEAGPSTPVLLLGLNGAPQAGDRFNVMKDEKEAKTIANKRLQLQREQGVRTQKHITLDEIGRRIAIGDFKELNIIVKGDVDGSVEALSDSLQKLTNETVQVNIIHKSVGQVTESDVLLASASDAIIIGFQIRPSVGARKLAEKEQVDIRLYSIIYQAIEEIKSAIEGMLSPEIEEKIVCNVEIREIFKISKVGTIAGCMVLDGTITRNTRVRIIRDGIVVYTGVLGSLKRFKDDVKEVKTGYECGLNIENFNDIKIGDIIEGFEEVEVKRK